MASLVLALVLAALYAAPAAAAIGESRSYETYGYDYDLGVNIAQVDTDASGASAVRAVGDVRPAVRPVGHVYDPSLSLVAPSGTAIRVLDDLPFPDDLAGGPSSVHVYFGVRDGKAVGNVPL